MKVIFLDVDGVLNSKDWLENNRVGTENSVNPEKVKLLAEIVQKINAEVVLSSTWRYIPEEHPMFLHLMDVLGRNGIKIHSFTPELNGDRPKEIKAWVEKQSEEVKFVSIEDDFSEDDYRKYGIENCLVRTSYYGEYGGLQRNHVEKAIQILNE